MNFYYNPLDKACKSIVGAVSDNEQFKIKVFACCGERCFLQLRRDEQNSFSAFPMQKTSDGFFAQLSKLEKGLYWYNFCVDDEIFGKGEDGLAQINQESCFQLTVYDQSFETPNWLKGGTIYQIFPDRFNRSKDDFSVSENKVARHDWGGQPTFRNEFGEVLNNEFFGGDLKGITQKMDYLESLGVTCIYLNPIFKAFSSHRYDTGNFLEIDELLGDENDLKELLETAKSHNIRVIFDGVFNHVGADSKYFNKYSNYDSVGAFNSEKSPFFDWFEFENYPNKYKSWWDFDNLPSIKKDCKSFQSFITKDVIPKYLNDGFCGVRLDVVDELSSGFVQEIRSSVKLANKDAVIIGEVWEDATNKIAYGQRRQYFCGEQLDSVMNYQLRSAIVDFLLKADSFYLRKTIEEQINNYPKPALDVLMNVLSTHDSVRILTELGRRKIVTDKDLMAFETLDESEYQRGKKLLKMAYVLVYTLYGVPSVFYGDEVGLFGNLDPYNRRCYPYGSEDKELLSFFVKLAKIRKNDIFVDGEISIVYSKEGVFIFERTKGERKVIIAVSRNSSETTINFSSEVVGVFDEQQLSKTKKIAPNSFDIYFC